MWWSFTCVMADGLKWSSKASFNTARYALDGAINMILAEPGAVVATISVYKVIK